MKSRTKNVFAVFLAVALFLMCALGLSTLFNRSSALASQSDSDNHYVQQLDDSGEIFYNALKKMNAEGVFESGRNYVLTQADGADGLSGEIKDFLNGDNALLKSFYQALDCFKLNNTDIFWVDFDCVKLNVFKVGNDYRLQIGSGRDHSYVFPYFADKDLSALRSRYNAKLDELLVGLTAQITDKAELVKSVCNAVMEAVQGEILLDDAPKHLYKSALSALDIGVASSEGYAKLVKACLDAVDVECVVVRGKIIFDGKILPHVWNEVKIGEDWLGVDVALCDKITDKERFILCDNIAFSYNHYADNDLTDGATRLTYPQLSESEIKEEAVDETVPKISSIAPKNLQTEMHVVGYEYLISIKYDRPMKIMDESLPVSVTYDYVTYDNEPVDDELLRNTAVLDRQSVVWLDVLNTLSFKFTASENLAHNAMLYRFKVENLVSAESEKAPLPISGYFGRENLYGDVPSTFSGIYQTTVDPVIDSLTDFDFTDFGYVLPDGTTAKAAQGEEDTFLVLGTENREVRSHFKALSDMNNTIVLSATAIELEFYMCGYKAVIPQNRSIKMNFGFPEGYDENKRAVYKLYGYYKDENGVYNYNAPQEIPCVYSRYGITAAVKGDGVYAVCAFGEALNHSEKTIDYKVVGGKGEISGNCGSVVSVSDGVDATFEISPKVGYQVEYAVLNGKKVEVENNRLTVLYGDLLQCNSLVVSFVDSSVHNIESSNGVNNVMTDYYSRATVLFTLDEQIALSNLKIKNVIIIIACAAIILGLFIVIIVFAIMGARRAKLQGGENTPLKVDKSYKPSDAKNVDNDGN